MEEEKWLPVVGYEGLYEVSDFGRVRFSNGTLKKLNTDKRGYIRTKTLLAGSKSWMFVHRLVARAFLGNPPTTKHTDVNHIDFDTTNNRVSNLEWTTRSENLLHSRRAGRCRPGSGAPRKYSDGSLREVVNLASETPLTGVEISSVTGVGLGTVFKTIRDVPRPKRPRKARPDLAGSAVIRPERVQKLTLAEVAEMRSLYAAGGIRQVDLAKQFGVGQATVSSVIRGETWGQGITAPSS